MTKRTKRRVVKTITTVLTAMMMITLYVIVSYIDTHYTKDATITYINHTTNKCVALDEQGHLWEFKANNIECGQEVKLVMNTNHTVNNTDDIVENVRVRAGMM